MEYVPPTPAVSLEIALEMIARGEVPARIAASRKMGKTKSLKLIKEAYEQRGVNVQSRLVPAPWMSAPIASIFP